MRILHVIPSLAARTGGPAASVAGASRALEELGHSVMIVTTDLSRPAKARRPAVGSELRFPRAAEQLDVRVFRSRPPRRFAMSPALGRCLDDTASSYDIVHIHSLFLYPQYAAYRAALRAGVPYVVSPRGALDPWVRQHGRGRKKLTGLLWQDRMLNRAAAIHVTSEQEAGAIADLAPDTRRFTVPNGIEWGEFARDSRPCGFRERRLGGFAGPLILSHGRITRKKGLDRLIRAVALTADRGLDCQLALVGPDDEGFSGELKRVAAEAGVQGRVRFCGMLVGTELHAALEECDVWALPSHTENFAVAAAEALAAGCAVVTSPDVGIAADASASGALMMSAADSEALARVLLPLLQDREARDALGAEARRYSRRFDWASVAPGLVEMYASLLSRTVTGAKSG